MPQKQLRAIDRLPNICAAGKEFKHSENVGVILKEYSEEDLAEEFIFKDTAKLNYSTTILPVPPIIPESNQLRDVLYPDSNKSLFLEFKDQFYENLYCKKVPLGKPTPANSKPPQITNESVVFGKLNKKSEKVYDIALPNRNYSEVLREYVEGHDIYRLSHGNYFPSEQIDRRYNTNFKQNQVFGQSTNADCSGKQVKNIIQNSQNSSKTNIISKAQRDFIDQHESIIGRPMRRQKEILLPETVFSRPCSKDDVKQLLNNTTERTNISYQTTYRSFSNDIYNAPIDCRLQTAGTMKSKYPRKGECSFLAENLGEETTTKQLISPSIPAQFGLSHRDFLLPRSKDQIRRIFSNSGFDLGTDEYFEKIWALALSEWTSIDDRVSVEAFKYALDKLNT